MIFKLTSIWFIIFILQISPSPNQLWSRWGWHISNKRFEREKRYGFSNKHNVRIRKGGKWILTKCNFMKYLLVQNVLNNLIILNILMLLISTFVDAKTLWMEWPLACKEWKGIRKFQWRNWIEIRYDTKWTSILMVCFNKYHRLLKNGKHHNEIYYHSICVTLKSY